MARQQLSTFRTPERPFDYIFIVEVLFQNDTPEVRALVDIAGLLLSTWPREAVVGGEQGVLHFGTLGRTPRQHTVILRMHLPPPHEIWTSDCRPSCVTHLSFTIKLQFFQFIGS